MAGARTHVCLCVCVKEAEREEKREMWRLCQCFGVSHDGWETGTYGLLLLTSKSSFMFKLFARIPRSLLDMTDIDHESQCH